MSNVILLQLDITRLSAVQNALSGITKTLPERYKDNWELENVYCGRK